MSGRRGSVLVQVLMMALLLMILASGVLRLVFMSHTIVTKVQRQNKYQASINACLSQKNAEWAVTNNGNCANGSCSFNTYTVNITCGANKQVLFQVIDTTW